MVKQAYWVYVLDGDKVTEYRRRGWREGGYVKFTQRLPVIEWMAAWFTDVERVVDWETLEGGGRMVIITTKRDKCRAVEMFVEQLAINATYHRELAVRQTELAFDCVNRAARLRGYERKENDVDVPH